mgnify:CR=1 FL=1
MPKYLLTLLLTFGAASAAFADQQITTGYLENIKLIDAGLEYEAKLDTGADNTSINAEIISFEKAADGTPKKVKFKLPTLWPPLQHTRCWALAGLTHSYEQYSSRRGHGLQLGLGDHAARSRNTRGVWCFA